MSNYITALKFTKFLQDFRECIQDLCVGIGFAIFPTVVYNVSTNNKGISCQLVEVSRHKIGCYGNVP